MIENKSIKVKATLYGIFAIIIVLAINWIVLSLLDYPKMALDVINKYYVLFILLIGGFGLQIGLFTYFHKLHIVSCSTTVASGGISGVSMLLCCSHYLVNILPFISLTFASFILQYTPYILLFGIFSNIFGIWFMVSKIKKLKMENG